MRTRTAALTTLAAGLMSACVFGSYRTFTTSIRETSRFSDAAFVGEQRDGQLALVIDGNILRFHEGVLKAREVSKNRRRIDGLSQGLVALSQGASGLLLERLRFQGDYVTTSSSEIVGQDNLRDWSSITDVAGGRGDRVYWTGILKTGQAAVGTCNWRGLDCVPSTQTRRGDNAGALEIVTWLDVDRATGEVYVAARARVSIGGGLTIPGPISVLKYNENLSPTSRAPLPATGALDLNAHADILAIRDSGGIQLHFDADDRYLIQDRREVPASLPGYATAIAAVPMVSDNSGFLWDVRVAEDDRRLEHAIVMDELRVSNDGR